VSDAIEVTPENLKLLCEIGILAMVHQCGQSARPIFELLDEQQPDNAAGVIGLALLDVEDGRERHGMDRLRTAIKTRKRCVREAKAVLFIVLTNFGRGAEARLLKKELMRGPDCAAKRLVASYSLAG